MDFSVFLGALRE